MLKRMLSLFLCAVLLFSLLPAQVFATEDITEPTEAVTEPTQMHDEEETEPETDPSEEPTEEETEPTEAEPEPAEEEPEPTEAETEPAEERPELTFLAAEGLDGEELLMGYLSPLYTSGEVAFFGTMAGDRLSPANRHLYDGLKERVIQLANGEVNNTSIDVSFVDSGYSPNDVNMSLVQEALLFDYPFEMYWYYGCYSGPGSNFYRVIMVPNGYYQASGFDYNTAPYIDTDKTKRASAAAENIYTITTRYEAYSDYDKLSAYADEICSLVTYDYDAANNSNTLYPNDNRPWTLINVFDNDPDTNVVCEGYSEAYQYLCDESTFQGDVVCFSVTGELNGGGHKWNIVRIEGVSYLMDVTNSDSGSTANRNRLFLAGGTGSVTSGYTSSSILFTYDDETKAIYGSGEDSVLKLSATKYTPPVTYTILYDANGGTGAPNSQKKTQGKDLILRDGIPERNGYTFLGWAAASTATEAEYQPGDAYSAEGDAVLYAVWEVAVSGTCGKNLTWHFDEESGTLTISGTGAMDDYSEDLSVIPWKLHYEGITKVIIEDGVTSIGTFAFYECTELTDISISDSVEVVPVSIYTKNLEKLVIPAGVRELHLAFEENFVKFIDVVPENETYSSDESGVLFDKEKTTLLCYPGGSMALSYAVPDGVTSIGNWAFRGCKTIESLTLPDTLEELGDLAFSHSGLTEICFRGKAPGFGFEVFSNLTADVYYPVHDATWTTDVMQDYDGTITWVPYGGVENQITISAAELSGQTSVWIDGREYTVRTDSGMPYVALPDGHAKTMAIYTYGTSNGKPYPNSMKVWRLSNTDGIYTATRVKELDNILSYEGTSIRVKDDPGIRMITSLDKTDKAALTGDGLAGYTLKEYGTAIAWASQISGNKPLVLGKSYVSSNYAYSKEAGKDPIFAETDERIQYTNVVVGYSLDQCSRDIAMRPYMILEDAEGNEIPLYGGIVERSIGYIAARNHDAFEAGTDANAYVWSIIHHVYGEDYIPE